MSRAKVVIIGCGLSGLIAGRELLLAGYDVVMLEKNSGIGGRCKTFWFDPSSFCEVGGMKVPVAHVVANHYVHLFGLEVSNPISVEQSGLLYIGGKKQKYSEIFSDPHSAISKVDRKWFQIKKELENIPLARLGEMYVHLTLTEYLAQMNWTKDEMYTFLIHHDLLPVAEMSFLAIFRVIIGGERTNFKIIEGGAQQLADQIATSEINGSEIRTKIRFKVQQISSS